MSLRSLALAGLLMFAIAARVADADADRQGHEFAPDAASGDAPLFSRARTPISAPSREVCPSDINGDGVTNSDDLFILLSDWGPCTGNCLGDVDDDGVVNSEDLFALLGEWGVCP